MKLAILHHFQGIKVLIYLFYQGKFPSYLRKLKYMCYMSLYFVILCFVSLDLVIHGLLIELWWFMVDGYCDCIDDHESIDGIV